jgi:hypothetical protein
LGISRTFQSPSFTTFSFFGTSYIMVKLRCGAAFLMSRFRLQRPCCQTSFSFSTNIITYLTDIEGDAAYLNRHVQQSKVLHFVGTTPTAEFPYHERMDFIQDNSMLVYGGDIWDRGGSDLYTIRQLLDLSRRYEGRVHFILGNRDLNKMRILDEIGVSGAPLPKHDGVYWLRGTGRVGDPLLKDNKQVSCANAAERLKWILSQTMGSPDAFELRKQELQRHQQDQVSDENVVDSYRRSCHPNGEMGQYLQQAHLALRLGNVLFVHGALPLTQSVLKQACHDDVSAQDFWNDFSFAMPWQEAREKPVVSKPNEWLQALEQFAREHVHDWKDHVAQLEKGETPHEIWSTRGGYRHSTLGNHFEALMQYGMGWTPDGNRNPTVVYSSWLNDGMPYRFLPKALPEDVKFAELTREFFKLGNLQLILSGHQPHGDMPTKIRIAEGQSILCCDTSYSGDTMWWNESEGENRTNIGRGSGSSGRGDVAVR